MIRSEGHRNPLTMVLLHAIVKKTQKTPPNELKTVKARLKDFNNRLMAQQRLKKGKEK